MLNTESYFTMHTCSTVNDQYLTKFMCTVCCKDMYALLVLIKI